MRINKFTGILLAGSIALSTVSAAPVSAASDGDRLAAILLGVAAVGLVVAASNNSKRRHADVGRNNTYGYYDNRGRYYDQRPRKCLRKKYTQYGWKTFYSRRCLAQHRAYRNDYYSDTRNDGYSNASRHNSNRRYHNEKRHHNAQNNRNNNVNYQYNNGRKNESDFYSRWNDTHK